MAKENLEKDDLDEFKATIVEEFSHSALCVNNIFRSYTGVRCHVSIKALDLSGNISTQARDSTRGHSQRGAIDEYLDSYPYTDNTAFKEILDDESRYCFISNRLRLRCWFGRYQNSHDGWQRNYRAVVVAPITLVSLPRSISIDNTYGFVCVDSMKGRFRRRACEELGKFVARQYAEIAELLEYMPSEDA